MSQKLALVSATTDDREAQALRFLCEDTASRLNVLLRLLESHNCHEKYDAAGATGGFDLSLMREELERIRERLREASGESGTMDVPRSERSRAVTPAKRP